MQKRKLLISLSAITAVLGVAIPTISAISCSKVVDSNNNISKPSNPNQGDSVNDSNNNQNSILLTNVDLTKLKYEIEKQITVVNNVSSLTTAIHIVISSINSYFKNVAKKLVEITNIFIQKEKNEVNSNYYHYRFNLEFKQKVKMDVNSLFEPINEENTKDKFIKSKFLVSTNICDLNDNLKSYDADLINNNQVEQFKPNILPYQTESSNPNDSSYNLWFQKINNQLLLSDLIYFLKNAKQLTFQKNNNTNTSINESDIIINLKKPNVIVNNINDINFNIQFEVLNNSANQIKFYLDEKNSFDLPVGQKVGVVLSANKTGIKKLFFKKPAINNQTTLLANYSLNNVSLTVNQIKKDLADFKLFNDFSRSLNNVQLNVSNGQNYLDIYDDANSKLKANLNINNIKNDISNSVNSYLQLIKTNVENIQPILIKLSENAPGLQFISTTSDNVENLIRAWTNWIDPSYSFLADLIPPIIKNQTAVNTINDPKFRKGLKALLELLNLDPTITQPINQIINSDVQIDQNQLNSLIDLGLSLIDKITIPFKDQLKPILAQFKTDNILDIFVKNSKTIWGMVSTLIPNLNPELVSIIDSLLTIATTDYPNKGILDILVDLKNAKLSQKAKTQQQDPNSPNEQPNNNPIQETNLIYSLLKLLIPANQQASLDSILNYVLNNPKINVANLQKFLTMVAKPTVTKQDGSVSNSYADFINSMTISDDIFSQDASFDNQTNLLNLAYSKKFTFGANIQWNNVLTSILPLIPDNIPNVGSLVGILTTLGPTQLPDVFKLFANDYFELSFNFNNSLVQFDVNNKKQLSWQALSNTSFDVNVPNTVKSLWKDSPNLSIVAKSIPSIVNPLFFQKLKEQNVFKPLKSSALNQFEYNDYDPFKKNNNGLAIKELDPTTLQNLANEFNSSVVVNNIGKPFNIAPKGFLRPAIDIQKFETNINFNIDSWKQNLFNLIDYVSSSKVPYFFTYNYQKVINGTSLVGQKIPEVIVKSITLNTYFNVYDLTTNTMKNSWTINLK